MEREGNFTFDYDLAFTLNSMVKVIGHAETVQLFSPRLTNGHLDPVVKQDLQEHFKVKLIF
ncbi:hypothetical protein TSAR_003002 [Trichomalopsis sarcophagae]|uniref:Uncharacterized protein n=1 Tax=Trichomalopsis sarcophagae TaxID=543379 RepID=A0A232EES7_9HYME|nr:hypothetical protein TSAR_003002 [Trichomalopsis sarcophagae]